MKEITCLEAVRLLIEESKVAICTGGKTVNGRWSTDCPKCNTWTKVQYKGLEYEVRDCAEHRTLI